MDMTNYKAELDRACEKFRAILEKQLVSDVKARRTCRDILVNVIDQCLFVDLAVLVKGGKQRGIDAAEFYVCHSAFLSVSAEPSLVLF